ncbi:TlpA family protein disulfide reductase [Pseudomaricurvus alkylphenolicus]|uniref:TlpA family protein disulfide reductase n=1 Tax=Pseudomaricurvus alkylphenolicus TaxID=1306991 RepID=UPI00141F3BD1|nr:TlpA disulfide reductase family protein [Pseudomaricurvus alkylphenolicus]NIB41987.1 TlpA family protein disulfide reductase [Pseudomaricurvus alkylphenolicus]
MLRRLRVCLSLSGILWLLVLTGCDGKVYETQSGDHLRWSELRGQWVFINYWALWCKPCRKEMPELNAFAREAGVTVLGVNYDLPQGEELKRQSRALGISFNVLRQDPAQSLGYQRPQVLPATYVFDPEGNYRGVLVGPQTRDSLAVWLVDERELASTQLGVSNE